jgi:hypothetical protein
MEDNIEGVLNKLTARDPYRQLEKINNIVGSVTSHH